MIKLYVDNDKVKLTREQYVAMQRLIEDWGCDHGFFKSEVNDNSSGVSTETFVLTPEGMEDEKFLSLYNKVVGMSINLEQASYKIKALLNRVEEFYYILEGEEPVTEVTGLEYLCQGEPAESVAVLDNSHKLSINVATIHISAQSAIEKTNLSDCCTLLSGLKQVNVSYEDDEATIEDSIKKQKYVLLLNSAFNKYVMAVNDFNEEVKNSMDSISEDEYTPVTTRTYNFSEMQIAGCDEVIITQMANDYLDQAGITEEEKQNALDNGMTLYQLAFDTSLVYQGDALRGNYYGITMWKLVLDGNYEEAFNSYEYEKNISQDDNALDIWYAIADYQLTSVSLDRNGNGDCTIFEAMLNGEIHMSDRAIETFELGAYYITMKKSLAAIVASQCDADNYDDVYKDYSKTLALYNSIVLCNAKMNEISGSPYNPKCINTYTISDISLKFEGNNAVVSMNISENHSYYRMDAGTEVFKMTVTSTDDTFSTLLGNSIVADQELIDAVKEEQQKVALEALKGGVYLATDVAGYSTGVGGLYTGVLKFSFAALEADYTSTVKTGMSSLSTVIKQYSTTLDNKELAAKYSKASNGISVASNIYGDIVPIYTYLFDNVFTNTAEDELNNAYEEVNKDNYALWFGSSAMSTTNEANTGTRYTQIAVCVPSPDKFDNYQLITSGGGIAELMGWSQPQIADVMKSDSINALFDDNNDTHITKKDVVDVINGGYDFSQEYSYTKFSCIMMALDSYCKEIKEYWENY